MPRPEPPHSENQSPDQSQRAVDPGEVLAEIGRAAAALAVELGLDEEQSSLIGQEVEFAITRSGLRVLTPGLVRELTMAVLAERGVADAALRARARIGLTVADAERLVRGERIISTNGHRRDPLFSDRAISSSIKREYALQAIFSEPVVAAHLSGDLHIENLGEPDRLFSLIQPFDHCLEKGKDYSEREIERALFHLATETRALATHLSGEIVWDGFNWNCAALLGQKQDLLAEYGERAVSLLADALQGTGCPKAVVHLDWDAPAHLSNTVTPEDHNVLTTPARSLMNALLRAGNSTEYTPVEFVVHITQSWGAGHDEHRHDYHQTLEAVTEGAAAGKQISVMLDRENHDEVFARYGMTAVRRGNFVQRSFCFGKISINLTRLALAAEGDEDAYFAGLVRCIELAAQAHLEKRVFLEKLLALGNHGPLARLTQRDGGKPFLKLDRAIHLICPVGLSEASEMFGAAQINGTAQRTLEKVQSEVERLSGLHKIRLLVSPSHSRNAPLRFARLDARRKPPGTNLHIEPYSVSFTAGQVKDQTDLFAQVEQDAPLHLKNMFEPGVQLNVKGADPKQLAVLISRAFYQSPAVALSFNP